MIFVSFGIFEETYAPYMLQERPPGVAMKPEINDTKQSSKGSMPHLVGRSLCVLPLGRSLTRPVRLLVSHPIIQLSSIAFALDSCAFFTSCYRAFRLWTQQYGTSVELSGLHYLACALGEVAGLSSEPR